ncbi:MAG: disulfide oxidoreductase [Candidatus Nanohaloarchaea archaeon]
MSLVQTGLSYLTLLLNLSWIAGLVIYTFYRFSGNKKIENYGLKASKVLKKYYREASLLIVSAATFGSLYFSEVLGWEPCRLCWYQRTLMYPLVFVAGVAVILEKDDVRDYILPLTLTGSGLSLYHYVVQRIEAFQSVGCSVTQVSCETQYTYFFDYITVPMMAFTAFTTVFLLNYYFTD